MTDLFEYFRRVLVPKAAELHPQYVSAKPFPNIVIDDFLPADIAERMLQLFPAPDSPQFSLVNVGQYQLKKLGRVQDVAFRGIDPWLRSTLFELNSMNFLDFLEALTGIEGLIPDPHFRGAAFHQMLTGGKLDVHADFTADKRRMLKRRINVLIYLNKDWKPEYNGELELWSPDMQQKVVSIPPIFNRCAIFNTSDDSYHGHPVPLNTPEDVTRKSIALYYYTSDISAFNAETTQETLWQATPE